MQKDNDLPPVMPIHDFIQIKNASENNLKSLSVDLPRNQFTVVTGVSGSGKSTLIFDVLYQEAGNRYLGSFSSGARQFFGKMKRPDVEKIEGISPALSVDQRTVQRNPRSTVGTMTGIYDYLRLLFARIGKPVQGNGSFEINRNLFSFNAPAGACPLCNGLGVEDYLDPELLVEDATRSVRDRALVITAPNGYIIYSQVTMEVMDQVCRAEGFSVDIPWKDLTPEQKKIILYGSDKIEIPFGKHTLESRMKWTGITAKPRETGYYKGIIPTMEAILKRDRNKNILRFVRTVKCSACQGKRLNDNALSVKIHGNNIWELSSLQLDELQEVLKTLTFTASEQPVATSIIEKIGSLINTLKDLGLGYLSSDRESSTLSGGEAQRLRLAVQIGTGLTGITYLFDEPSIGLHPRDTLQLIGILMNLRDKGNTVIVIEHEEEFIRHADWLVDIGPGAGIYGGELMFSGPVTAINTLSEKEILKSRTLSFLKGFEKLKVPPKKNGHKDYFTVEGATAHNLKDITVKFRLQSLNVITGVSGAGKSSLAEEVIGKYFRRKLNGSNDIPGKFKQIINGESLSGIITIDQSPIGRTPRSNPATYTGLFDPIRDLFAALPEAIEKGFSKGYFSFNTEGGRCEACQGAGYQQIGMHFMGNVEILCEVCEGKRFKDEVLAITWKGKSIYDVLEMFISEAKLFFEDQPRLANFLNIMEELGLGYIKLGQRSTTLSGGEAQRIKLATELARSASKATLYILDEPTTGLHQADVSRLLDALSRLAGLGHTLILIEHHCGIIAAADHIVDLGPGSGKEGGYLIVSGTPADVAACEQSYTGQALKEYLEAKSFSPVTTTREVMVPSEIILKNVSTNNLQHIDITIPHHKTTVITGVSGSGKSSLAFDTIFAEGKNRFMESFSTYVRTRIGMEKKSETEEMEGLTPTLAIDQRNQGTNSRSTVGTTTGIYDLYRLLYARVARSDKMESPVLSSLFSYNHQHGACEKCDGLGKITLCDEDKLITYPGRSILDGAMDDTKTGKFYGDPHGQYVSTLKAVAERHHIDYSVSWKQLSPEAVKPALYGTGDEIYDVTWEYLRGDRSGSHHFSGKWQGFLQLVNEEYTRKHADHRGQDMLPLMKEVLCPVCLGARLNATSLSFTIGGHTISAISDFSIDQSLLFFKNIDKHLEDPARIATSTDLKSEIIHRLDVLSKLGLPYLQVSRESASLSGGESQRVKLASLLGSGLTGITYIPDEPTLGLHPADTARLLTMIRSLREEGNTVIMVEHDREVILSADHIIDMGPGAGRNGGKVVAQGTVQDILNNPSSITGKYLQKPFILPSSDRNLNHPGITIKFASAHNLKIPHLDIPTGGLIAITGVSGAGKSTLLFDVILESWKRKNPVGCSEISGLEIFSSVTPVQQRSSFSSTHGTPVTFTGIFDKIRELFAKSEDAQNRKLTKNHFSFNNKEGRCPECEGNGVRKISMDFLPDVEVTCETCNGQRYRQEILDCLYQGRSIDEILSMTLSEMREFFTANKTISPMLELLEETGLGYLVAGQSLESLSGGESRRLILATELMKPAKGKSLYLFEEPSAGLHFSDIEYLTTLFRKLTDHGHTLLIIEHDPDIIAHADWIIDLGPEGGEKGGEIVATGRLAEIMLTEASVTGKHLLSLATH